MLTATYSLVALANEISRTRRLLSLLQIHLKNIWEEIHHIDLHEVKHAFKQLSDIDHYSRNRKFEQYLIPAITYVSQDTGFLLKEWETLRTKGVSLLEAVTDDVQTISRYKVAQVNEICQRMEMYCHTLSHRLNKEEDELMPFALDLFSAEQWFSIAEKFLVSDGQVHKSKTSANPFPISPKEGVKAVVHEAGELETRIETLS